MISRQAFWSLLACILAARLATAAPSLQWDTPTPPILVGLTLISDTPTEDIWDMRLTIFTSVRLAPRDEQHVHSQMVL